MIATSWAVAARVYRVRGAVGLLVSTASATAAIVKSIAEGDRGSWKQVLLRGPCTLPVEGRGRRRRPAVPDSGGFRDTPDARGAATGPGVQPVMPPAFDLQLGSRSCDGRRTRVIGTDMSWDRRAGRSYYSRSRKVGGRTVREYVGPGDVGARAAAEDAQRRAERQAETAARRAEQQRWREATAVLRKLCDATDLLVRAVLVAAGYHRHDRGAWRRRHVRSCERGTGPRPPGP
jgi:hypothetical protein